MSEELKNKLYNYTATPPERNWEAVTTALDNQSMFDVQRLRDYEEPPGSHNWNKITSGLAFTAQPASSTPVRSIGRPLKWMIAAAVLGLVAFGIIQVMNSSPLSGGDAVVKVHPVPSPHSSNEGPGTHGVSGLNTKQDVQHEVLLPSQQAAAETAKVTGEVKLRASRYVTINNDEGKTVRLSKKAYTLVACAENSTATNYNDCKENIQLMQQKMSASLFSPSGDFSGLVDMVRSLEEQN